MRTPFLLLVLVLAVFLAACSSGDELVVTEVDSTAELRVGAGDMIEVRLESNPSTGYSWGLSDMTSPGIAELESQSFVESEGDLVGAPGTDVFVFKAADSGAGILRLEYVRQFDDPPVPERVVEYIVRIDDAPWPPERDDAQPPSTSSATAPLQVRDLFNGDGARDVTVAGAVIWEPDQARLCEAIMESYPPQCGGQWVVITNPTDLDVDLETDGVVEWTQSFVELTGFFDGDQFTVG